MIWKRPITLALLLLVAVAGSAFADSKEIKKLKKEIARAAASEDEGAVKDLMREIADFEGEDALEALYDIGLEYAVTEETYDAALQLLGRRDAILTFLGERYDKIDSKGDFRERVYIADILARVPGGDATKQLAGLLQDDSPFVKGAAVEHLAKSLRNEAIGPLITLLEELSKKRRDVLYHQVRDALWELTGQDFDVIDDWVGWWETNEASFDPKKSDHEGKTGVERKRRGDEDPDFWGVPVESKNVVFVIDTSGSMRYVMKTDIPGLARGDGSDTGQGSGGGNMTAEQRRLAEFWMRINMAKRELVRVIGALGQDAFFNCVQFNTVTSRSFKSAKPGSNPTKKSAFKWVEGIKHKGNTATLEALLEAFNADARTNTIYFLSDGLPSKDGKTNDPTGPILERLFKENRFRKIKIHTFGIDPVPYPDGGQPNPDLVMANDWLKKLAEATGGKFTIMKVDPRRTPDNPNGD
jgi:hypothetical protein